MPHKIDMTPDIEKAIDELLLHYQENKEAHVDMNGAGLQSFDIEFLIKRREVELQLLQKLGEAVMINQLYRKFKARTD